MFGRKKKSVVRNLTPNPKLNQATAQLIEDIVLEAIENSGNVLNAAQKQALIVDVQQAFQDVATIDPSTKAQIIADVEALIQDFTSEDVKTLIHSKTFWVNVIGIVALLIQWHYGFVVDPTYQAGALAVINIILRKFTSTGVTLN